MFSLYPSAYPRRQPSYYDDDDYYVDRDYLHALAQQQARQRREAQHRAQLEEVRRRKAYQEQLAHAEAARRRNSIFMGGFDDEPYSSFMPSRAIPHPRASDPRSERITANPRRGQQVGHDFLEDLMQQQMAARAGPDGCNQTNMAKASPSCAIPVTTQMEEKEPQTNVRAPSPSPDARDVAARKIQAFIRIQLPRLRAFKAIANVSRRFENIKAGFQFPSLLDFADSPPNSDTDSVPTLLFTARNAPLHGHEHVLVKLLSELDTVDSYGDARIRRVRKELVKRIECELGALDEKKAAAWKEVAKATTKRNDQYSSHESPKAIDSGYVTEEPVSVVSPSSDDVESIPMDVEVEESQNPNADDGEVEDVAVAKFLAVGSEEGRTDAEKQTAPGQEAEVAMDSQSKE